MSISGIRLCYYLKRTQRINNGCFFWGAYVKFEVPYSYSYKSWRVSLSLEAMLLPVGRKKSLQKCWEYSNYLNRTQENYDTS